MKNQRLSLPVCALLSLCSVSAAETIEQGDLNQCNTVIDFESIALGQQSNPLTFSGVVISSPTFLSVSDITPFAAAYPELALQNVLTTVLAPDFSGSHQPLTLVFSTPVAEVGMGWVDPNAPGNKLMAFDAAGVLLEEVEPALFPTGGCCADFVGIRRPTNEIASVVVQNAGPGDYYAIDFLSFGGWNASEVVRLGTPPNPDALRPGVTTGPVLGQIWDPVIDHTTFMPGATLDLMVTSADPLNLVVPRFGTLLCDPTAIFSIESAPAESPFAVAIPSDCTFAGFTVCTQGASLGGLGNLQFTNALDLTLGTY